MCLKAGFHAVVSTDTAVSTTQTILRSYRAPGAVARELRARGADEMMVLTWLVIACVLFFVARLPGLARVAHFNGDDTPLFGLALGTFFGTIFLAPVVFFALAGLSHLVARIFGAAGSYLDARIALFWSLLAITPLVLLQGLVAGLIGQGPQLSLVSGIVFVGFLYIWIGGLMALEKRH